MGWKNANDSDSGSESGSASKSDDSSDGSRKSGSASGSRSGSGSGSGSAGSSRSGSSSCSLSGSSSQSENEDGERRPAGGAGSEHSENGQLSDSQDGVCGKSATIKDVAKSATKQPDLYGIRRSGRQRKEVTRYTANSDSDERPASRGKRRATGSGSESSSASEFSDGYRPAGRTRIARPGAAASRRAVRQRPARPAVSSRRGGNAGSSDDYSDSDDGQTSRAPSQRATSQKVTRAKPARSRRKVTKMAVSYKEESEAATESDELIEMESTPVTQETNDAETIESVLHTRLGLVGATGSSTALYNVRDHGDPNTAATDGTTARQRQYMVKWKHWAHIHNTWETEQALVEQKVNGLKRLDFFKKKQVAIDEWRASVTREDIDYYDCQKEMQSQLQRQYLKVERIFMHAAAKTAATAPAMLPAVASDADASDEVLPDYLVKWECLPYADCTWEDGRLIALLDRPAIDGYHVRQKSTQIPSKYCKVLKTRPKFVPLKLQPELIGSEELVLRDYQMEGLNWLLHSWCKSNGVILADEMGLGKTIQTIAFLSVLCSHHSLYGPFLLVVPLSTIATWQREFELWAPHMNCVVYLGDINSRNKIREYEWCHVGNKRLKFNVLITTYEIVLKDRSFLSVVSWAVLGVDEAHRLKNDDSLLYQALIAFNTNHRILITGTPLQNSLKELWSLLQFIMPDRFHSWVEFEEKHSTGDRSGFRKLHKELEPFLLRRMKKDVEKSLPAKVEQILRVEMAKTQKQYYKWILTKNYKALSKGRKGNTGGFINLVMELKKCCNHSFLIKPPDDTPEDNKDPFEVLVKGSGKLILLDKLLMRLRESDHRVLIFSQMVRMLDILAEYMQYRRFPFQRLDGSISGELRKQAMDHFNADGSEDFCFLLSTRAGGLGVNLATADIVIIYDSDWNPQNDLQAQARAHRIGQKKQVSVYRLVTKGSVEEDIIERAKKKLVLDHLVIQRMDTTGRTVLNRGGLGTSSNNNPFNKEELTAILKFGAEELFKETDDDDQDIQVDIDDILKRAETHNTEDHSSASDELLSQFKVVSFDNMEDEELEGRKVNNVVSRDWDDIIPEADRKQMDDEEMNRHMMELNLPPRSRKKVTQLNLFDSDDDKRKKGHRRGGKGARGGEEESESSDDSDDPGGEWSAKKRGRRRGAGRQAISGFSDAEVRRFVRSYKRFGRPHERLDAIAGDAELQEKSQADLVRLADLLKSNCLAAMAEYEQKLQADPQLNGKKTHRGPTFPLSKVTVNAKSVLQAVNDLEPLAAAMPADREEFAKYQLNTHVKSAHFDCLWDIDDDSNLLKGVYEYGMGNWEPIKMDPALNLYDKILPDGQLKPQSKHLQTRADHLMKVLRKQQGGSTACNSIGATAATAAQTTKKSRGSHRTRVNPRVVKSKEMVDDSGDDSNETRDEKENCGGGEKGGESPKTKRARKEDGSGTKKSSKKKKKKEKERLKKEAKEAKEAKEGKEGKEGPMHFTTNETVSVLAPASDPDADLPTEVFSACKEKMRPVKKSLRQLGNPDQGVSDRDQLDHTRHCLLRIGTHIDNSLLDQHRTDVDAARLWRSYLWIFVSKFTEFDAARLYKLYKHAMRAKEGKSAGHNSAESSTANCSQSRSGARKGGCEEGRGRDGSKPPSKKGSSDVHSDNSRDSLQGSGVSCMAQPGAEGRGEVKDPVEGRWQQTSPLARQDARKNKFNDAPNSYSRPPSQYNDSYRGFSHDDRHHARYDGREHGYGGGGYYRGGEGYSSRYESTTPHWGDRNWAASDHRDDYWSHRQGGHDRYSGHSERKRRRNDFADRDRHHAKEAKSSEPDSAPYPPRPTAPSAPLDPRDPRSKH